MPPLTKRQALGSALSICWQQGTLLATPEVSFHVGSSLPVCLHLVVSKLSQKCGRSPVTPFPTQRRHCTCWLPVQEESCTFTALPVPREARGLGGRWPKCPVLSSSGLSPTCPPVWPPSPTSASLGDKCHIFNSTHLPPPASLPRGLRTPVICYRPGDSFMPKRGAQPGETP